MKVVALAGGTGSGKLLRGLAKLGIEMTVVANVGDNAWIYGVYVCPDIDIAAYTLCGIADRERGWGIEGDSHEAMRQIRLLGEDAWFSLGDRDLAVCMARTLRLARGESLSQATSAICSRLGVRQEILPVTDEPVETRIVTPKGEMHLQEFWVRRKGRPRVLGVRYAGARRARICNEVEAALLRADRIVFCPANPVTSIGPILAVRGMKKTLQRSKGRKTALSPMIGGAPVSGPAGKLLRGCHVEADSTGVATLYRGLIDSMIIDGRDSRMRGRIAELGTDCVLSDIVMRNQDDERRLAKELLEA